NRLERKSQSGGNNCAMPAHHARQQIERGVKVWRTEEYPSRHDSQKSECAGDESACPGRAEPRQAAIVVGEIHPGMIDHQVGTVKTAPEDERPIRPVPQTSEEHGDPEVHIAPRRPASIAAQAEIEI